MWGQLGRDFWLFRFGQALSIIGDSCGAIALAWWILEITGSAAQMSAVIAPATFVRIILLPLFGPLGDRFDRKKLIFVSDIWRSAFMLSIGAMISFSYYNLTLLISLYLLSAIGTAVFHSVSGSIVPQIVKREHLQNAMRQNEAIQATGTIIGGLAGGALVTFVGLAGAFYIDGVSFILSGVAALMIRSNTNPKRTKQNGRQSHLQMWITDLKEGFKILLNIRVLFWLCIVAMALNFFVSPIGIILPVLVKQARQMPPWFLGTLQSSVGAGAIIGSVALGFLVRKLKRDYLVVLGVTLIGAGIVFMPWVPNAALPLTVMFVIGAGSAIANILLSSQRAIATPDEFRSRISSIMGSVGQLANPMGLALAGVMIEGIGLTQTLGILGGLVIIFAPFLWAIPKFKLFMRSEGGELSSFFQNNYPEAFR